jgi:hypothetical protein
MDIVQGSLFLCKEAYHSKSWLPTDIHKLPDCKEELELD